jgi:carbonic anhydrase/acetyltransferase-like protein (isoleucine patch superfamily)
MKQLEKLRDRIIQRVDVNLRRFDFDVPGFLKYYVPLNKMIKYYALYGITPHQPLQYQFDYSNLAGSNILGRCKVNNSILYKCNIRGDELKSKGDALHFNGTDITLDHDEMIHIKDSFLIKTLVHNCSHNPENPELFLIKNTASAAFVNIHGSWTEGCFLSPFSTVDLTSLHGCAVGTFAYVQVGELWHEKVASGQVWVKAEDQFDFKYNYPEKVLKKYIDFQPDRRPSGIFIDFLERRKEDFQDIFNVVHLSNPLPVPKSASLSRYAVVKPKTRIAENVLIAQHAYIESSILGKGANAQEYCYIIDSKLMGNNVTAHGAKLIDVVLEQGVFVGFNSFLRGTFEHPLRVGESVIVMPHTIIDMKTALNIPAGHLVWGLIRKPEDLKDHSIALEDLAKVKDKLKIGALEFTGSGKSFVEAFRHRIDHILEANGAYYDGKKNRGHAQKTQHIAYNIIQPHSLGLKKGVYPTIDIRS